MKDTIVKILTDERDSAREELKTIKEARLVWSMTCACMCDACRLFDRTIRGMPAPSVQRGTAK